MSQPPRVMVVDDEAVHRETLSAILTNGGIRVTCCERPVDALELLRKNEKFDLIFSDVVMPGMDGIEFARQARKLRPRTPLVLVTGRDSAMDSVLNNGTVALIKPYSTATLNAVLSEHLGVTV